MATRKTVKVETLLNQANSYLKNTAPDQVELRRGVCSFIETVLFEANAYAGFGYLDSPYVAGVTDDSRRSYYKSHKL
jgi:hypothetical protein